MSKAYAKTLKATATALFAAALSLFSAHASAQKRPPAEKRGATAASVSVSTRAEYRVRVLDATAVLEALAVFFERTGQDGKRAEARPGKERDTVGAFTLPSEREAALEHVRKLLPVKERVEASGGALEVDNTWLHSSLDEYAKLDDNDKRAKALRSMSQRLRALEARLAEAEGADAAARDKDAERGRLNAILRDPEFNKPPRGNAMQRIVDDIKEWLVRHWPNVGGPAASRRLSALAQALVIALCVFVIAYVARRMWLGRARELKTLKLKRRPRVILGERLDADDTPADLLAAAEGLARAGDLRGAIRKAYVALLCGLGDGGVIRLAQHKTNRDYLDAVRRAAPERLYTEMLPLTRGFEQHWYGLRDATAADWDDYNTRCRQALRQSEA
jgi:hypothetical protein